MPEIVRLQAHDPIPEEKEPHLLVMHRMAEDDPAGTETTITVAGQGGERLLPPDGDAATLDGAVEQARQFAESHRIDRVYVIDRTDGPRERDILSHGGDHSVHMEGLSDDDLEDGEHGPDMRDRRA